MQYGPVFIWLIITSLSFFILISVIALPYSLTFYVAYDNPEMNPLQIVNRSVELMKGNIWKLLNLELSFIGWAILASFTYGIGYFVLIPYIQVSIVCFYESLLGKKNKNDEEFEKEDTKKSEESNEAIKFYEETC